jgi:hypothetical protein
MDEMKVMTSLAKVLVRWSVTLCCCEALAKFALGCQWMPCASSHIGYNPVINGISRVNSLITGVSKPTKWDEPPNSDNYCCIPFIKQPKMVFDSYVGIM